jgi:hypothetical protein
MAHLENFSYYCRKSHPEMLELLKKFGFAAENQLY